MKVRNGFVTNSSSSSYIIAFKNKLQVDDETLIQYPWIDTIKGVIEDTFKRVFHIITTKEELDKEFPYFFDRSDDDMETCLARYIEDGEEWSLKIYNDSLKNVESGCPLLMAELDNDEDIIPRLLRAFAEKDICEFIMGE